MSTISSPDLTAPLAPILQLPLRLVGEDKRWAATVLWNLVRRHRAILILLFLATLLTGLCEGSTMAILVLAIRVLISDSLELAVADIPFMRNLIVPLQGWDKEWLFFALLMVGTILQVLKSLAQLTNNALVAELQARAEADVHQGLFVQMLRLSYGQITSYRTGDLTSYSRQAIEPGYLIHACNDLAVQVTVGLTLLTVLLFLYWKLTLAVLLAIAVISWPVRFILQRLRHATHQRQQALVTLTVRTVEYLQSLRLLHTFNRQEYALCRYEKTVQEASRALSRGRKLQGMIAPLLESLTVVGVAGFLFVGFLVLGPAKQAILSHLLGFLFVLYRLLPKVILCHNSVGGMNNFWPGLHRLAVFLRTDDKEYAAVGGKPIASFREIEFRNVSFRYPGTARDAVTDVSFRISHGRMVALVGGSGAGKSTIADLLLRLYDPSAGQILVDGVDLLELDPGQWRKCLGVVSQDALFFNTSIRDNVAFGELTAADAAIVSAIRIAGADSFVEQLPAKHDTVIGERGLRLSGGQRQQLAIARAILRNPQLLLLDEATSSLDNQSERLVQYALEKLGRERTVLAIAHRLSTIMMADEILVLQHGRVVERGTHAELLALQGYYMLLWQLQAQTGARPETAAADDTPAATAA